MRQATPIFLLLLCFAFSATSSAHYDDTKDNRSKSGFFQRLRERREERAKNAAKAKELESKLSKSEREQLTEFRNDARKELKKLGVGNVEEADILISEVLGKLTGGSTFEHLTELSRTLTRAERDLMATRLAYYRARFGQNPTRLYARLTLELYGTLATAPSPLPSSPPP